MALETRPLNRSFIYNGIKLPDVGGMSPEQVKMHYAGQYAELSTATIVGPKNTGTTIEYEFRTNIGTKG